MKKKNYEKKEGFFVLYILFFLQLQLQFYFIWLAVWAYMIIILNKKFLTLKKKRTWKRPLHTTT